MQNSNIVYCGIYVFQNVPEIWRKFWRLGKPSVGFGLIISFILTPHLFFSPVLLGRVLFSIFGFPNTNDIYTFCAGFYIVWGTARGLYLAIKALSTHSIRYVIAKGIEHSILVRMCAAVVREFCYSNNTLRELKGSLVV